MTARREPSTPPRIPGYEHVRLLGLGGFADVFLYRQELPSREVAVKVLLAGSLDDDLRTRFQSEANLMARLSHHPSIVTIHQADIAADGRPFLVMEYCSRPGLAERYRQERLPVAEVLRIGVRLSSAIETAHRAGILHRDIKPANVLTTDFGWPALTDFGIAATTGQASGATVGMSIPWSPPELLGPHPSGDARSDVYSLAATVYSLLAGRSPFEVPGGQNGAQQLVARIERSPLPPTGRDDVPPDLQALLERAMAKHPARRFESAVAVGRALQQVEAALRLPVTPLDLLDEGPEPGTPERPAVGGQQPTGHGDDATRLRSIVTLDPASGRPEAAQDDDRTRLRPVMSVPVPAPVPAAPAQGGSAQDGAPDRAGVEARDGSRGARPVRIAVAVLSGLVVVATALALALNGRDDPVAPVRPPSGQDLPVAPQGDVGDAPVPSPRSLQGVRQADGSVVFTWENPDPQDGDRYLWGVRTATAEPTLELVDAPTVVVPAAGTRGEVCIEVSIVRADRQASASPAHGCVT